MRRASFFAALLIAACSSTTESADWQEVVGTIEPALSSVQLVSTPTEAVAGVPFVVTIRTLGSSTCTRAAGASARSFGRVVTVTPRDRVYTGGTGACTRDLASYPRDVPVRFVEPGEGTLRIVGRSLATGAAVTYELTIPVRPLL